MVYEVHGLPPSGNTQRALVVLAQLGLLNDKDFKLVPLSNFAEAKTDEYKSHQPFGQIPYLKDTETGVEVYESRAIGRYLAHKHNSSLFVPPPSSPGDAAAHAKWIKFEMAASAEVADLDFNLYPIARELVTMPRMFNTPGNQAVIEYHQKDLANRLTGYELILSKQKYLAGDELTLIDLFVLPFGFRADSAGGCPGMSDGSLPNVTRWWKEISSLPAWKTVFAMGQPPQPPK